MKFWKRALFINLVIFGLILVSFAIFFQTPTGRPVGKTLLLIPEVLPWFPVRPLEIVSKEPIVSEVEIAVDGKKILADIYRPNDDKKHPAIIIALGAFATRQNSEVIKLSNAISRLGYVVLAPDLPDLISGYVWNDSIKVLVSSVKYLDNQAYVKQNKIGFAGFCIGGSVAIAAAEQVEIAEKIAFIATISPYFDLISLAEEITTNQTERLDGKLETWKPADLSVETLQKGFINYVPSESERQLLTNYFLEGGQVNEEKIKGLSDEGRAIYNFLRNSNRNNLTEIWQEFPESGKRLLTELSPSAGISNLKAKLFILNDKNDTFVSKHQGERLAKSLPSNQTYFTEIDSFEHVNPKTTLPRLALVKQLVIVGQYVYGILSQID